jgi:hypothetical protein
MMSDDSDMLVLVYKTTLITLMTEAENTSEMSVLFHYFIWRKIPEGSNLYAANYSLLPN